MSSWRKCDTCRKVRPVTEFEGDATTCQTCLTAPVRKPRAAAAVTTRTRTPPPREAPEPSGPRPARLGSVGAGDLEVRERRARRAAYEALAAQHAEEFAALLREARVAEGLRG